MPKLDLDNVEKVYTNVQNYKCVSKFKLLDDILIIIQMIFVSTHRRTFSVHFMKHVYNITTKRI